jgi:hypothetical protein
MNTCGKCTHWLCSLAVQNIGLCTKPDIKQFVCFDFESKYNGQLQTHQFFGCRFWIEKEKQEVS